MSILETPLSEHAGIEVPLICGAMYPCSNPELVAAASAAGGLGIVQPLSLVYVHGHDFREGLALIRRLTDRPVGLNVIVERSSKVYLDRMKSYVDAAIEEGVRFFVTSLGKPHWVVERAHAVGGVVYHDVTERKWAEKALEAVDVDQGQGLDDADAAGGRRRSHRIGVAARVHGAADQRDLDAGVLGEGGFEDGHEVSCG